MWFTPDATASRRTASAAARSFGGPNTPGPESCIAPNPRRLTCQSPSANVPDCSTPDIGDPKLPKKIRGSGDLGFDLLDRLDVGFDVHAVTDHHPAGLQHLVPREPEVLAIDRGLRGERCAHVPPWVLRLAVLFDPEDHLSRESL